MPPRSVIGGHIVFALSVCLCVCLFVGWSHPLCQTLTLAITFEPVVIGTSYLACICISLTCTFSTKNIEGQGHSSRSKVKFMVGAIGGHSVSQSRFDF